MEKTFAKLIQKIPWSGPKPDSHRLEILAGSATAFVMRCLDAGFSLLFSLVLARLLGAEGTGLYSLALTATYVGALFGRLGLENAMVRFTSAFTAKRDWGSAKGAFTKGMKLSLAASAAASLILFLSSPFLALEVFHKPNLMTPFRLAAAAILPLALSFLLGQALRGLSLIRDSILVEGVVPSALALLFLWILAGPFGVNGALASFALSNLLAVGLGFYIWNSKVPKGGKPKDFPASRLMESGIPTFWISFMGMLLQWIPTFALGLWSTEEEVGIFSTAFKVSLVVTLILMAVSAISGPKFAAVHGTGQKRLLFSLARYTMTLSTLLSLPLLVLFLAFPGFFMGLFGPDFEAGAPTLMVLAAGQFVSAGLNPAGNLLMMVGQERLVRNRMACTAFLSLLLNILLIPPYGAFGASLAMAICLTADNLASVLLVRWKLGIWVLPFFNGVQKPSRPQ